MANLRHEIYVHDGTDWNLINPLLTLPDFGISVAASEINLLSGATSNIQTQIDTLSGDIAAITSAYLPLAGGTMTGQLKTSFLESVAVGSRVSAQTTVPDLINELRYSSGCMGSVNITTVYSPTGGASIPVAWYNYLYIPHRSGGINGTATGDNCNYGTLLLTSMTGTDHDVYVIKYTNEQIVSCKNLTAALTSHTHPITQITWENQQNLTLSAPSANNAEYSIDMPNTTYTGSFWHVWSGKQSKSIIACYNDDSSVVIPSGQLTLGGYNVANTYAKSYTQIVDLTSLSTSTWYPVCIVLPYGGFHRVSCVVQLDSGTKPSWAAHNSGFTAVVEMLVTASGWGTTNALTMCLQNNQIHLNSDESAPVGYTQFTNSSRACFYCRGGAKYKLLTDFFAAWTIYSSSTTVSNQTIAPVTSYPGISFNKTAVVTDITGSASSAGSALKVGDGTLTIVPEKSNEVNFGGTNTSTSIYFGYRAKDSRAIPTDFIFGGSTGTATLTAGKLRLGTDEDVGLNKNGSLIIGSTSGYNLAIDANEIMARNNGAASTLYINTEGGTVYFGSGSTASFNASGYLTSPRVIVSANSRTLTIGPQNSSFYHVYGDSTSSPIALNMPIAMVGNGSVGTTSYPTSALYVTKTGGIYSVGTKQTYKMIDFIDNTSDTYGNGIAIGGGGQTIIGGGESATTAKGQAGTAGAETMWICNDGNIDFYSNCQSAWSSAQHAYFNTSGDFIIPRYYYGSYANLTGSASATHKWNYNWSGLAAFDSSGWLRTVLWYNTLYEGSFASGSTTLTNAMSYQVLILVGAMNGGARSSVTVPTAVLTTSAINFQMTDETYWVTVSLTKASNAHDVTMSYVSKNGTSYVQWVGGLN